MGAIQKTFSGTGTTDKIVAQKFIVATTGTFSATIKIKWVDDFEVVHTMQESGADLALTGVTERVLDLAYPQRVYAEVTAYTSGSPVVFLAGSDR